MLLLVAVAVGILLLGKVVPGGFIPDEDKGYLFVAVELPEGASLQRTDEVLKQVETARPTGVPFHEVAARRALQHRLVRLLEQEVSNAADWERPKAAARRCGIVATAAAALPMPQRAHVPAPSRSERRNNV